MKNKTFKLIKVVGIAAGIPIVINAIKIFVDTPSTFNLLVIVAFLYVEFNEISKLIDENK